jgi:hypothetical protein
MIKEGMYFEDENHYAFYCQMKNTFAEAIGKAQREILEKLCDEVKELLNDRAGKV